MAALTADLTAQSRNIRRFIPPVSVIEGFTSYLQGGYQHRADEVRQAMEQAIEFMLLHQLFVSDRTGEIIDKKFLQLTFPARWKYNVLRGMDALRAAEG